MRCTVCKKSSDEVKLFSGILEADMIMICEDCAENESVPIIKKPSDSQLNKADQKYSVRERMEIMSGFRDRTEVSEEQLVTQGNLARLRSLPKKQQHENVVSNYYWNLSMARRRKKLTANILAKEVGTTPEIIRAIERGILPGDFESIFSKLEVYLGIKMLKNQVNKINFIRNNREEEKEILENVKQKMNNNPSDESDYDEDEEFDLKKKKDLNKVTISDLLGIKKRREAKRLKKLQQKESEEIEDEDLEIEIEEL